VYIPDLSAQQLNLHLPLSLPHVTLLLLLYPQLRNSSNMSSRAKNSKLNRLEQLLVDSLLSSERRYTIDYQSQDAEAKVEWNFEAGDFFDTWFRTHGRAYFFLFRKNLKVTNIQFAELLSLIRSHNYALDTGKPIHELQFLSVTEFYDAIRELVSSFPRDLVEPRSRYELIAKMYCSLIARHVVLDSFFGSCAVFLPPNLEIDLSLICAHSGYVHSCGINIYTRKIDKAKKRSFFAALERHLSRRRDNLRPVFFMVYAHEDFTKNERAAKKEYLRNGLDDVKIYIEKFYMAAERLIDVVEDMRKRFDGRLILPPAGENPGKAKANNEVCDQTRTLWLLVDHSISDGIKQRGEDRFYICYEQQYLNESPFQLFDENKPAWLTPTTIPHTLLAAMMNLTELSRINRGTVVLSDPFVGTGTTWLESTRIQQLIAHCTDKSDFAPLMIRDNFDFFCQSAEELRKLKDDLELIIRHLETPTPSQLASESQRIFGDYKWAISFYDGLVSGNGNYTVAVENSAKVKELSKETPFKRLLFYLTLRTIGRSSVSIRHGTQKWGLAYAIQARHLAGQISLLSEVRTREEQATVKQVQAFSIFQSVYSLGCTLSRKELIAFRKKIGLLTGKQQGPLTFGVYNVLGNQRSAKSSLKPDSCDVIITDPPYGFNTDDDLEALARLYAHSIEKMIMALKNDGQLVLCLLDRSHTGRRSPYFTHKELITQQVLSIAERARPKREVIIPAYAVPKQRDLFRPPYYWESDRALRRAILHFRIRTLAD
jgi:hypothetical protein